MNSVTIICNSYPPEKGAAPTRIYNLAKMLQDHGYHVEVVTAMPNYPTGRIFPGYRNKLSIKEEIEGIQITRLWLYPSNSKTPISRIASMLSQSLILYFVGLPSLTRKKPDIIIVSTPPILLGYNGILIAKYLKAKAVLNVSDIWPLSALELGAVEQGKFYRMLERVEKSMYKLADVCVGQSQEILDRIESVLPGQKKQFLYRNLQELSEYASTERPGRKKKIVYAGMLGIAQGVLEICHRINFQEIGVELHIYGDGIEKQQIVDLITENPDRGIFYHNSIPGKEVPKMLSTFHATLVPLKTMIHGAVPSKIFMAMANAIPVFFSAAGEGADIVKKSGIGWVNSPGDYQALENNIRTFVSLSNDEYEEIRKKCVLLMKTEYSKSEQDKEFDRFLREALKD
jgi:glycosyltransferase involved in cell wall biosynthesis